MKISIGTANFGLKYGIKNNQIPKYEIDNILEYGKKNEINFIDTASSYGNSEKILGQNDLSKFLITSKYLIDNNNDYNIVQRSVLKSIKDLNIKKLESILIHNSDQLLRYNYSNNIDYLKKLRDQNFTNYIGLSIYDFDILDEILKIFIPDIIQVPFNILDRRLLANDRLNKYTSYGISVEVRSIFLQGLLITREKNTLKKFDKWDFLFRKWHNWLDDNSTSAFEACLNFIKRYKEVSKVIIGIDSLKQLEDINDIFNSVKYFDLPENLAIDDKELILPYLWRNT